MLPILILFISSTPGTACLGKNFSADASSSFISLIPRKLQTAQAGVTSQYGSVYTLAAKPNAVAKAREVTVY